MGELWKNGCLDLDAVWGSEYGWSRDESGWRSVKGEAKFGG